MNITKMGTEQLRKAIAANKFEGDNLEKAKTTLAKRDSKAATPAIEEKATKSTPTKDKKAPAKKKVKKEAKEVPKERKGRGRKAPAEYTEAEIYPKGTISGLVRRMIKPKDDSKVAGCTFGEASKAVEKKHGRPLHPSEFDRNFKFLVYMEVVTDKRPPRYKQDPADASVEK